MGIPHPRRNLSQWLVLASVAGCALAAPRDGDREEQTGRAALPIGEVPIVREAAAPKAGEACSTEGESRAVRCGRCGLRETACEKGAWGALSSCTNEVGECTPGAQPEPCGACGRRSCTSVCAWGTCIEPAGACAPDTIDLSTAGCPDSKTFRVRTCTAACAWGPFSASCAAPPRDLTISASQGATVQGIAWITREHTLPGFLLNVTDCPMVTNSGDEYPVAFTVLHNKGLRAAIVSVFTGARDGTPPAADAPHLAIYEGTGIIDGKEPSSKCARMPYRTPRNIVGFDPNKNHRDIGVADSDLGLVGKFEIVYGLRMTPGATFTVVTMAASPDVAAGGEPYSIHVRTDFVE